jgi:hypothetical protein
VVAARDLDQQPFTPPTRLWHGYLGPGKVTLLTSQWKSGKTTLFSLLLAGRSSGCPAAGRPRHHPVCPAALIRNRIAFQTAETISPLDGGKT